MPWTHNLFKHAIHVLSEIFEVRFGVFEVHYWRTFHFSSRWCVAMDA